MEIKIKIKTDRQEIELTLDEFQELKKILLPQQNEPIIPSVWRDPIEPNTPWYNGDTIISCA